MDHIPTHWYITEQYIIILLLYYWCVIYIPTVTTVGHASYILYEMDKDSDWDHMMQSYLPYNSFVVY